MRSPYVVYINRKGQIQLIWPPKRDEWVKVMKVNDILVWTRITSVKQYQVCDQLQLKTLTSDKQFYSRTLVNGDDLNMQLMLRKNIKTTC